MGSGSKIAQKTLAGQTDRHTVVKVIGICLYERLGIWKCTFLIGMVNFFSVKVTRFYSIGTTYYAWASIN